LFQDDYLLAEEHAANAFLYLLEKFWNLKVGLFFVGKVLGWHRLLNLIANVHSLKSI
jgi:hypothetical protein